MSEDRIEREVTIEAPVAAVWELVSTGEHLGAWFADAGAEIDLRPGGELELRWHEHGTVRGRVERVEPERLLGFRWAPFQDPGGSEPDAGNSTLVEIALIPEGSGTRVRVTESGFAALGCDDEQRDRNHSMNSEGWEHELGELVEHAGAAAAEAGRM